jgi:hypothetical protein
MKNLKIVKILIGLCCISTTIVPMQEEHMEPQKKPLFVRSLDGQTVTIEIPPYGSFSDVIDEFKQKRDLARDVNVVLITSGQRRDPTEQYGDSLFLEPLPAIITRDWLIKPIGTLLSTDKSFSITYRPSYQVKDLKDHIRQKITDEKLTDTRSYSIKIIRRGGYVLQDHEPMPLNFPLSNYTVELDKIPTTGTASSLETQSSTATSSLAQASDSSKSDTITLLILRSIGDDRLNGKSIDVPTSGTFADIAKIIKDKWSLSTDEHVQIIVPSKSNILDTDLSQKYTSSDPDLEDKRIHIKIMKELWLREKEAAKNDKGEIIGDINPPMMILVPKKGTVQSFIDVYRKKKGLPSTAKIKMMVQGKALDPKQKYNEKDILRYNNDTWIFPRVDYQIENQPNTPSGATSTSPQTVNSTASAGMLQASDSSKDIEQTHIVKISGNYKITELSFNENPKTYKALKDEYKKVRGLAKDVGIKLLAKGEEIKDKDEKGQLVPYYAGYIDQVKDIYYALIYRDWHIKSSGNLLPTGTSLIIRLFPDEPGANVPAKDIIDQTSIENIKQNIIGEIAKNNLTNEKNYTVTITKDKKPLNDTDTILFTESLNLYGITLNKPSRFQLWANWLQQQKNKVLGVFGIAAASGLGLYFYSQKNKSLPNLPH